MFSVAALLAGKPADFPDRKPKEPEKAETRACFREDPEPAPSRDWRIGSGRRSYFANYEMFSTFTPSEYPRPAMELPFRKKDGGRGTDE